MLDPWMWVECLGRSMNHDPGSSSGERWRHRRTPIHLGYFGAKTLQSTRYGYLKRQVMGSGYREIERKARVIRVGQVDEEMILEETKLDGAEGMNLDVMEEKTEGAVVRENKEDVEMGESQREEGGNDERGR